MSEQQLSLMLAVDSPLIGKVKNDRSLMVWNFFALTKERVTELSPYRDGNVFIEVKGTRSGVATIWDKEILIYVASLMMDKVNRGEAALLILKHYCVEGPSSEIRILASSMQGNFVRGLFTAI
jgi:plasmid replication initiation protein